MQNNQRGRRSEKGATSVEYALIIILVVLGLGGAVKAIGTGIDGVYSGVADNVVAGAATGPASTPPASSTPPVPVKLTATASLAKGASVDINVLSGLAGATIILNTVTYTAPQGGNGDAVVASANGNIKVTAPKNKTGTMVITYSYVLNGVTVTGNTLTVTIIA